MKILVTGAAGFIGFHVVEKLIECGHEVAGLDNLNGYYQIDLKYGRLNVSGIAKDNLKYGEYVKSSRHLNYSFIKADLEDKEVLLNVFSEFRPDIVINLAAQAGVRYSLENPEAYLSSNIIGFSNILECCRRYPVKHLVYASSSSVYGLNEDTIFSSTSSTDHPVSLYASTKKANEGMAHAYSHLFNIPTTGLRFFTVYGPWGRPDMALFIFTKAILEGNSIDIFNNGEMYRDFTYIDDIVSGVIKIATSAPVVSTKLDSVSSIAPWRIYNIGNSKPVKLLDFVKTIEKILGKEAIKNLLPLQPGDVVSTYADTGDLERDFGYKPSTPLFDGISEFIQWYNSFYKNA